jgi:hypothetical protein
MLDLRLPSALDNFVPRKCEKAELGAPRRLRGFGAPNRGREKTPPGAPTAAAGAAGGAARGGAGAGAGSVVRFGARAGAGTSGAGTGAQAGGAGMAGVARAQMTDERQMPAQRVVYLQLCDLQSAELKDLVHEVRRCLHTAFTPPSHPASTQCGHVPYSQTVPLPEAYPTFLPRRKIWCMK